ncbi:hypothetical protein NSS79_10635 [Paenibacillus sp. FSL L8-0436]|uniref:hypothetical protein n=1 Tax=Paenibacillus sp. FSL L8-0436 TaxID=2954686 RepID=UPI003157F9FE
MTRFMKPLTSNVQLYTAQIERVPIVVFVSGVIEDITEVSVKIRGLHYMRAACTFKYAS